MSDLACKVLHTCSELGNSNHSTGEGKVTVTIVINSNFRLVCRGNGAFSFWPRCSLDHNACESEEVKGSPIREVRPFCCTSERSGLERSSLEVEKFFSSVMIHYSQSLPSLIVRSEFRKLLGPKFTRKFGFLHRIANSNTLCLLNSPLSNFSARSSEHCR